MPYCSFYCGTAFYLSAYSLFLFFFLLTGYRVPSRVIRKFVCRPLCEWGQPATEPFSKADSKYFICFFAPLCTAAWRSLAQTSIRVELPSRKVPTTRVRRRISQFSRSMTLLVPDARPLLKRKVVVNECLLLAVLNLLGGFLQLHSTQCFQHGLGPFSWCFLTSVVVKPFRNTTTYLTDEIASLTEKKEIELTIFSIRLIIISTIAHNSNFCFISHNVCFFIFLIHFCYECLFIWQLAKKEIQWIKLYFLWNL